MLIPITRAMQRRWVFGAWGVFLLFFFLGTYHFFVNRLGLESYRIFDLKKTLSWTESDIGLYRLAVNPDVDNLILSRDPWQNFILTFNLVNPREPGIVFHVQDMKNYYFVYFQSGVRTIMLGKRTNGVAQVYQGIVDTRFSAEQLCRLEVTPTSAKLFLNDKAAGQIVFERASGQFGFLVKDIGTPTTVFQDIAVQGKLKNGRAVSGHSPPLISMFRLGDELALAFFYLAMVALSVYLSMGLRRFLRSSGSFPYLQRLTLNDLTAGGCHFLLAAAIFLPFFLQGKVFVSSYDNFGEIYPLFFFSKHQFQNWIAGQGFSLWNPFFHNGTPFYSSHWNMIYDPLNWPIFFMPDTWVLTALTVRTFLEVFLIGFLAYKFFTLEIGERPWALFAAICFQLCSVVIFAFNLFPTISLYFAMILFLYLVWSMPQRRVWVNYAFLTFAVYLILVSANVAFVFYAVLALGGITLFRCFHSRVVSSVDRVVLFGSGVTGFLLSAVRLLPCLWAIADSNRIVQNYYTFHDRAYMAIRLFLPEIVGWFGPESFNALASDNLNLIFHQLDLPSNPQNAFFAYFGILAVTLVTLSVFLSGQGRFRFWKSYVGFTLALALLFQPVWGILNILFFPFSHYSYHIIILPIGFAALAGWTGQRFLSEKTDLAGIGLKFFAAITLVEVYAIVFLTYLFPALTAMARGALLLIALAWGIYFYLRQRSSLGAGKFFWALAGLANFAAWVVLLWVMLQIVTMPFKEKEELWLKFVLPLLSLWAVVGLALLIYLFRQRHRSVRALKISLVVAGLGLLFLVIGLRKSSLFGLLLKAPEMFRIYTLDILLGQLKIFFVLQIGVLAVVLFRSRLMSRRTLLALVTMVLALDLLAFQGRYDNITAPFYHRDPYYGRDFFYGNPASGIRPQMDLANYRVSALNKATINANKSIIFSWPSYIGTLGYLSQRFSKFISNFGFPPGAILIYPEDEALTNDRFLDLCAVRYVFQDPYQFAERPSSLSRLNLFYDFEVGESEDAVLARLVDPAFLPSQKLVLAPQTNWGISPLPGKVSERIAIAKNSNDEVQAKVKAATAGIALFVESYDPGWIVTIDGQRVIPKIGNYNFIAFPVPSGEHEIRLRYQSRNFFVALGVSGAGLVLFSLGLVFLFRLTSRVGRKDRSQKGGE